MATLEQQIKLESEWKHYAETKLKQTINKAKAEELTTTTVLGRNTINTLTAQFYKDLVNFIIDETKPKRGAQARYRRILVDMVKIYTNEAGIDDLALLCLSTTLINVLNKCFNRTNSYSDIAYCIGREILAEVNLQKFINETSSDMARKQLQRMEKRNHMHYRTYYLKNMYDDERFRYLTYSKKELISLGATLVEYLCNSTGLFEVDNTLEVTKVIPTAKFLDNWNASTDDLIHRAVHYIPTIIEPKEWTSTYSGAYYSGVINAHFIRLRGTKIAKTYERLVNELDIKQVYQAVNKIQRTPYRLNKAIIEVIQHLLDNNISFNGFPSSEPLPEIINTLTPTSTEEQIRKYKDSVIERIYEESRRKSHMLRVILILNQAKQFCNYEKIYIPHNIDFRGRVYPLPMLNPQGDDLTKALFTYSDPVPCVDENDFNLLCIQGANLYGNDKISFSDRIKFIKDQSQTILDVANDPYGNRMHWQEADEPFQFLAFCFEYANAVNYMNAHNNSIIGYKCGIVIAFDGTCSGIQHYSAMLRDPIGGKAVNLINSDIPMDIYGIVAERVNEIATFDAQNGTPDTYIDDKYRKGEKRLKYGTKTLAQLWLTYGITRKVTKRSVMTLSYGSEQYGFSEHIYEDIVVDSSLFRHKERQASRYMAGLIWQAVNEKLKAAPEAMKWLKYVAKEYTKRGLMVSWTTPLGLPVMQQYTNYRKEEFRLKIRGTRITRRCYYLDETEKELSEREQIQGIAPNFIHSLDASHLMLVVNHAELNNYTTVHDSFGTSLGEAQKLKEELPLQFYLLYCMDSPLESLRQEAEEKLSTVIKAPPTQGTLDLTEVMNAQYLFH